MLPTFCAALFRRLLTALFLIVGASLVLSACSGGSGSSSKSSSAAPASSAASSAARSSSAAPTTTKPAVPTKPVHVNLLEGDGSSWGIGFAVVARFDRSLGTSREFTKAVKVTVNGAPYPGAWFFQRSNDPAYKMEGIFRGQNYWPAHAKIHVDMPIQGLSAGPGLSFAENLTLDMATGPALIGTVDAASSKLTVDRDGVRTVYPVALGAPNTPTQSGTKVVMIKLQHERMVGSGYDEVVPWSMRITADGEYLHAASWNVPNIMAGRASSNGCTNMLPADAQKLWAQVEDGDVFQYPNAPGKPMPSWDGYGWWNVPWSLWNAGGLLINHGSGA